MPNIADMIERMILRKLAAEDRKATVLRRNELAEELDCAPSQISYVLSTRFTIERGFIVESRRGSGGFVRIGRIPVNRIVFTDAARQFDYGLRLRDFGHVVGRLADNGFFSADEAALMRHFLQALSENVDERQGVAVLRSLLENLSAYPKEEG